MLTNLAGRDPDTGDQVLAISNGTLFSTEQSGLWNPAVDWQFLTVADVDGDGSDDFVARNPVTGDWHVARANGVSGFDTGVWGTWQASVSWGDFQIADVDGDGDQDVVGRQQNNGNWWVALSDGSGFTNQNWGVFQSSVAWTDFNVADVNGDGKDDIVGRQQSNGNWWVALSNGSSFTNQNWGFFQPTLTWASVNIADVNGDGNDDIVARQQSNGKWWVAVSDGVSGFSNQDWGTWAVIPWLDINMADVDGDGDSDIIGRQQSNGAWWVGVSDGVSGFANQNWGAWSPISWLDVEVVDVDDDGDQDIVGRADNNGALWVARSNGTSAFVNENWGAWNPAVEWIDAGPFVSNQTGAWVDGPSLTAPAPLGTPGGSSPNFDWTPVASADHYELVVQSLNSTGTEHIRETSIATDSFTPSSALPVGSHVAWVRAVFADQTVSAWSPGHQFTIGAPPLSSPSGVIGDTTPLFTWDTVPHATRFDLWVDNETSGEEQVIRERFLSGTSTTFEVTADLGVGDFTAWLRAFDDNGNTAGWSQALPFTIALPSLIAPAGTTDDSTPTLQWTAWPGATHYDVSVVDVSAGGVEVIRNTSVAGTTVVASALPEGDYQATVRAFDVNGTATNWSEPADFSVEFTPEMLAPEPRIFTAHAPVSWTPNSSVESWSLIVREAGGGTEHVNVNGLTVSSLTLGTSLPAGDYEATVRAVDPAGNTSAWSDVREFAVILEPAVLEPSALTTDTTPLIQWQPIADSVSYDLELEDTGTGQVVLTQTGLTTHSYTPASAIAAGSYQARVRYRDQAGTIHPWGAPVEFQIQDRTFVGDFDGDGRDDIAVQSVTDGRWDVAVQIRDTSAGGPTLVESDWGNWQPPSTLMLVGDFNGDGRDDLASQTGVTDGWQLGLSDGTQFYDPNPNASGGTSNATWDTTAVGDFNADRRDDIAARDAVTGEWHVSLSSGTAFRSDSWGTLPAVFDGLTPIAADFSGDGRDDLAVLEPSTGEWTVAVSAGTGFISKVWDATWTSNGSWSDVVAGDFNGDGLADLSGRDGTTGDRRVAVSNGHGFDSSSWGTASAAWTGLTAVDVNRDGHDDLVGRLGGHWQVALSDGATYLPDQQWTTDTGQPYFDSLTWSAASGVEVVDYHYRLDSALESFEFVRNEVRVEFYAGLMKGAQATDETRAGNAWDQSTLLWSKLADSGVDARIAKAKRRTPTDEVLNWTGTLNETGAEAVLKWSGLAPTVGSATIDLDHAWVRAWIPGGTGLQWVDLDPSWTMRDFQPGIAGIVTSVPLDRTDLFSELRSQLPFEYYEDKVQEFVTSTAPGKSLADVPYDGPIIAKRFTTAIGFESVPTTGTVTEFAQPNAVTTSNLHQVKITLKNGSTSLFARTYKVFEQSLSAINITFEDVGGGMRKPQIRIDNVVDAEGAPILHTATLTLLIQHFEPINPPFPGLSPIMYEVKPTRYIAVGLNAHQVSETHLNRLRRTINDAAQQTLVDRAPILNVELGSQVIGTGLSYALARYWRDSSRQTHIVDGLIHNVATFPRVLSGIGMADEGVTYHDDLQIPVVPGNPGVDLKNFAHTGVPIDGSTPFDQTRLELVRLNASALESSTVEAVFNTHSVSTVTGLQDASEPGNAGYVVLAPHSSRSFIKSQLGSGEDSLSTDEGIVTEIHNESSAGRTVTVPRNFTEINDWRGYVLFSEFYGANPPTIEFGAQIRRLGSPPANGGFATAPSSSPPPVPASSGSGNLAFIGDPVNVANGNMFRDELDVTVPNIGLPVSFARRYNSQDGGDHGLGIGWSHAFGDRWDFTDATGDGHDDIVWFTGDGSKHVFEHDGQAGNTPSNYANPKTVFGTLDFDGIVYSFTDKHGLRHRFERPAGTNSARLIEIRDRHGNTLGVAYDSSGRISTVSDVTPGSPAAVRLSFDYSTANQTKLIDPAGREWIYDFSTIGGNRYLTQVSHPTDPQTAPVVVGYEYYDDGNTLEGLMKTIIEPNGGRHLYTYYPNRRAFEVTDAEGYTTALSYDLFRGQTNFTDERGHTTEHHYNDDGLTTRQVDPDRTRLEYEWNDDLLMTSSTDVVGNTQQFTYYADNLGNLHTVTQPNALGADEVTTFEYESTYNQVRKITRDPTAASPNSGDERVTEFFFATNPVQGFEGNFIGSRDAGGNLTTSDYTPRGLLRARTSPRGNVGKAPGDYSTNTDGTFTTEWDYDDRGLVAREIQPIVDTVNGQERPEIVSTYDTRGNLDTLTDATGIVTEFEYDLLNRQTTVTVPDPDGAGPLSQPVTGTAYNVMGDVVAVTDPLGNTTHTWYDLKQNVVEVRLADGSSTRFTYDGANNPIDTLDAAGDVSSVVFDSRNRPIALFSADGSSTRSAYDASGRVLRATDERGHQTLFTYDRHGRLLTTTDALSHVTANKYDAAGNRIAAIDRLGYRTDFEYDLLDRVTETRRSNGLFDMSGNVLQSPTVYLSVTTTDYDPDGNPTTSARYDVTDTSLAAFGLTFATVPDDPRQLDLSLHRIATTHFDALGRPTGSDNPAGDSRTLVYDAAGRVRTGTDEEGRVTETFYDAAGRRNRIVLPDPDETGPSVAPEQTFVLDEAGNLLESTDAEGRTTRFEYDLLNRLVATIDALGGRFETVYDTAGRAAGSIDALGHASVTRYDERGRVVRSTRPDPDGNGPDPAPSTTFSYDVAGNLIRRVDPLGRIVDSTWDALNRLETETVPHTLPPTPNPVPATVFTYDANGNPDTVTDPLGRTTTWQHDGLGRVELETTPDPDDGGLLPALHTAYEFDALGNLVQVTGHSGQITTYTYDVLNRRVTETQPDPDGMAGSLVAPSTMWTYDKVGNVKTITDQLGRVTSYEYDNLDRRTSETLADPDGAAGSLPEPVTQFQYDLVGNLRFVTDAAGGVTEYEYDALDRRTLERLPDPGAPSSGTGHPETRFVFDALGNLTSVTDPVGRVTQYEYDNLSRTIREFRPDPDGHGSPGSIVAPETVFAWDLVGNLTAESVRADATTVFTTTFAYNDLDQRITATDPRGPGHETSWEYDVAGNLHSLTDASGNQTTWQYDRLDRVTLETSQQTGTSRVSEYDTPGRLIKTTDRLGRTIEFTAFDNLDRAQTETWKNSSGQVTNTINRYYNDAGLLESVTDNASNSEYRFTYDALDRTASVLSDIGMHHMVDADTLETTTVDTTYTRDVLGRRTKLEHDILETTHFDDGTTQSTTETRIDDGRITYAWDVLSRLTRLWHDAQPPSTVPIQDKRVDLAWTPDSRLQRVDRFAGLTSDRLVATTRHEYHPHFGWLSSISHDIKGPSADTVRHENEHDAAGRITQFRTYDDSLLVTTRGYDYDPAHQITDVTVTGTGPVSESFTWDETGNRTGAGYTTGVNNLVLSDGTFTYTYDAEGNRTTRTNTTTGEYVAYSWDNRNRLTQVEFRPSAGAAPAKTIDYTWDTFNRRISKTVTGPAGTGSEWFLHDIADVAPASHVALVFEGEQSFAVANRYLHGPQVDRFFADENAVGDVLWSLADHQGTVRDVINQDPANASASEVVNHLDYDAFGGIASQTDAGFEPAFTYTGREWDADANLYHYRARWYDADAGRFLSEDPLGFDGGDVNLTRYVGNNTINSVDPSGLRVASAVTTSLAGAFGGPAAAVAAIPTSFAGAGLGSDRFNVPLVTARLNGNRLTPVGSNAFPRLPVDPFEGATLLPVPAPPQPHISDLFVAGYRHQAFLADVARGMSFADDIRALVGGVSSAVDTFIDAGDRLQQAVMRPFANEAQTLRTAARHNDHAGVANRLQAEFRASLVEFGGTVISSLANPIGSVRGFGQGVRDSIEFGAAVADRHGTFSGIVSVPLHLVGGVGATEQVTGRDYLTSAPLTPLEAANRGSDGLQRFSGTLLTAAGGLSRTRAGRIEVGEGAKALLRDESGSIGIPARHSSTTASSPFDVTATFRDGRFREVTLQPGTRLQRAFEQGVNQPVGSFLTRGATARRVRSTQTAIDELGLSGTSNVRPNRLTTLEVTTPVRVKVGFIEGGGKRAFQYVVDPADLGALRRVPGRPRTLK